MAVTSLCLFVAILVVTITAYLVASSSLEGQLNRSLRQQFDQIARSVRRHAAYVVTGPCQYGAAPACARVVDAGGSTVTVDGIVSTIPVPRGTARVANGQSGPFLDNTSYDGQPMRIYAGQLKPGQALLVAEPTGDLRTDLRDLELALAIVGAVGSILLAGVTVLVTRANLAPVATLVADTRRIAAQRDPSIRVEQDGHDELSVLAGSFNAVLEQLDTALAAQRALVADASHELRTPLTSLRANAHLLRQLDRLPPAQRQATVAAIDAQVRDLVTLVNALIDLARGEEVDAHRETIRLDELVSRCVRRAQAHWSHATLIIADLEPFVLEATPSRLTAAVSSVLDNAAKFAGDAGPITVALTDGALSISDRGPGIPLAERQRIFDRFYRAPDARAVPGSGLGLAIAHDVTVAYGGTIAADVGPDNRGVTITLRFPKADIDAAALTGSRDTRA